MYYIERKTINGELYLRAEDVVSQIIDIVQEAYCAENLTALEEVLMDFLENEHLKESHTKEWK